MFGVQFGFIRISCVMRRTLIVLYLTSVVVQILEEGSGNMGMGND
jgi:hypothetical protein